MEKFEVGDVVLVLFPFSNLKGQKLRPALIVANAEFNNLILCQITSKAYSSRIAVELDFADFADGKLPIISFIRPDKLFTADSSIVEKVAGTLKKRKLHTVLQSLKKLFSKR